MTIGIANTGVSVKMDLEADSTYTEAQLIKASEEARKTDIVGKTNLLETKEYKISCLAQEHFKEFYADFKYTEEIEDAFNCICNMTDSNRAELLSKLIINLDYFTAEHQEARETFNLRYNLSRRDVKLKIEFAQFNLEKAINTLKILSMNWDTIVTNNLLPNLNIKTEQ